jgi:glycolate oxidase FAD binding subunit
LRPASATEAAECLRGLAGPARIYGNATKLGTPGDVCSLSLDRVLEHNAGDFTAVLEAGVRLADARAAFAEAGQMLAWDPPHADATIGGVVAGNDSGPLRHRYGGVRDLVVGITVALSDGTVAKAGGKVIKNVAGYDLGKLFAGSQGTLGMIVSVAVRLHPRPELTATVAGSTDSPQALARAAIELAQSPIEADCLDVRWRDGHGTLLVRFSGAEATRRAQALALPLEDVRVVDETVWDEQRAAQEGAVKIPYLPTELPRLIAHAGSLVARAGLGLAWVPPGTLTPPEIDAGANLVMRRLKQRFDPAGVLR